MPHVTYLYSFYVYTFIVIVKKFHFDTIVRWIHGFGLLLKYRIYERLVTVHIKRTQIKNHEPILQKLFIISVKGSLGGEIKE
jgi:hypothetical protein